MPASRIRERITKGIHAQVVNQGAIIVVQVGGVAAFVHFWGLSLYGEWLILFAIPSYLGMSDVGFTTAIGNEMVMLTGRRQRQHALKLFRSAWSLLVGLALVLPALVMSAAALAPVASWLQLNAISEHSALLILLLFTLQVLLSLTGGLLYAGFACEGHYGAGTLAMALSTLLEFAGILTALVLDGGPPMAAAGMVVGRLVGVVGMRVSLKRLVPWLELQRKSYPLRDIRHLTGPALASAAFPLGNALNLQGMVLVVGAGLGPASVAIFSTVRTLTRFGMQLLRVIWSVTAPEISAAFGAGNAALLKLLHRRSCQISAWVAAAFVLGFTFLGGPIVDTWTGGMVPVDRKLLYILLTVVFVNALWYMSLAVLYATNRHQRVALDYAAGSLLALPLAYVLLSPLGLPGAALSLLALELFMAAAVLRRTLPSAGDHLSSFLSVVWSPPLFILRRGPTTSGR